MSIQSFSKWFSAADSPTQRQSEVVTGAAVTEKPKDTVNPLHKDYVEGGGESGESRPISFSAWVVDNANDTNTNIKLDLDAESGADQSSIATTEQGESSRTVKKSPENKSKNVSSEISVEGLGVVDAGDWNILLDEVASAREEIGNWDLLAQECTAMHNELADIKAQLSLSEKAVAIRDMKILLLEKQCEAQQVRLAAQASGIVQGDILPRDL